MKLDLSAPAPEERVEGEKIYLRPITEADIDMVLEWRNAPRTVENFYYRKPITHDEQLQWIRTRVQTGQVHQFVVVLKETQEPIGCVYLQHFRPERYEAESGVFFSETAPAGQGLAAAAVDLLNRVYGFGKLGLHRSVAKVLAYNTASRKLHEKVGFVKERLIEHDAFLDGKWEDTILYGLYREELEIPCAGAEDAENAESVAAADKDAAQKLAERLLRVEVPGSKSITNRALLLAMLGCGTSTLKGVLFSEDSEAFLGCVQSLGYDLKVDRERREVSVTGCGGDLPKHEASLYVGSAGTAARFLTAVLGVSSGSFHMDSSDQMKRRPMAPLLRSLAELGAQIAYEGEEGFFPFTLCGHGFGRQEISIDIGDSSQFLSALLVASALAQPAKCEASGPERPAGCEGDAEGFTVHVEGRHGMAYIRMTARMMEQFGVRTRETVREEKGTRKVSYVTPYGQSFRAQEYEIEPDASAAAYFYAMCPLLRLPVRVRGIHFDSLQGDVRFIRILERMGCEATDTEEGILLSPPEDGHLRGITVNMSDCSDQAITLSAIAPFADVPVRIEGIGHIRLQESDRLSAISTELERLGIRTLTGEDWIEIFPGEPCGALVETYGDHRMAMGFSLIGLRVPHLRIRNPYCCRKTFAEYFADLYNLFEK